MMNRFPLMFAMILFIGVIPSRFAVAQPRDPIAELTEARRIYVPIQDLDVVIERDKEGVLISRAKFDSLLSQAKANIEKNPTLAGVPVALTAADYAAQIVGDQLLISVKAEINQFDEGWCETSLPLQRLALERATLDDAPAFVGRNLDGSVSLFTYSRGKHALSLQLSTELITSGSDQAAVFSLLRAPSGSLTLSLPAGKRLVVDQLQLERPAALEQVADYQIAVGGSAVMNLRITDRAAENAADSLMFATTGYGLHVAPGEVTWHARSTLQLFGKPVDRLTFSVPSTLEIADVEAVGLESWNLTDDPNEPQRTNISLTFGQAFEGTRQISLKGVMSVATGKPWDVPPLRITGVTSHIGQIVVEHQPGIRLRIDETSGMRRATQDQKPAADMPDGLSKRGSNEFLRFDVWRPDFTLRLTTQPKQSEVHAAVASVLDVNVTGLDLHAAITVEAHFAPLFEIDVRLPSEWQVLSIHKDDHPLAWQMIRLDEVGINQLRILLEKPLAAETNGQFRLALRRDVEGWPVEAEPIVVNLPELFLPQSSLTEVAIVVRGDADLDLLAFDLKGLDPQPMKADFERLRFQSQDTRFAGKLKVTRKPSRISAQTVTFGRIDPQTIHTFLQATVDVQGGGVRSIKVALPETTGTAIRFESTGARIVEQKSASPQNGERVWTLQFDRRLRGPALLTCDLDAPRGEMTEFVLPQWRFADAERQSGYVCLEAGGEQRLTMTANEADGSPLVEVDTLELPQVVYRPKERIVAVYRSVAPRAVVSLKEQKFDKLAVPTAICPSLDISTIVGRTGELQHQARFLLNTVGVQGLHVTFPSGSTLWATTIDGRPVEVRRHGDVYLVPIPANIPVVSSATPSSGRPDVSHLLQLTYRSDVVAISQFGTLNQTPPILTVESAQRTAMPVEVLEQRWNLYYPEEMRLVGSHSPLAPLQPLDTMSILGAWNANFRAPTFAALMRQVIVVCGSLGIICVFVFSFRRKRFLFAQIVVICALAALFFATIPPSLQQARDASRKSSAPAEKLLKGLDDSRVPVPASAPKSRTPSSDELKGGTHLGLATSPDHSEDSAATDPFGTTRESVGFEIAGAGAKPKNVVANEPAGAEQAVEREKGKLGSKDAANRALGLLSLAIDFVAPAGSREKRFHYIGADVSSSGIPLQVDYVDRHSGMAMRVFLIAFAVLIAWILRRSTLAMKLRVITLGVVIPMSFMSLAPIGYQVVLDGVLLGTLAAVGVWLARGAVLCCPCNRCRLLSTQCATTAAVLTALFAISDVSFAAEKADVSSAKPAVGTKPMGTLIVPYDAGTDPLASDRIFLSHEQFLELYRLANPTQLLKPQIPQAGGILEALYSATLVPNTQRPDDSVVQVTARYAARSFVDGQMLIELPVKSVSARDVKLDGQAAALMAGPDGFKIAISKPGLHVIDFAFDIPARLSGMTGAFTLPLLAVPSGKLTFGLPAKELSIRVNGSSTVFRRVTQGDLQSIDLPIDKGGEITIVWQPPQARDVMESVVQADSALAMTVNDAGGLISQGFVFRVRQGGLVEASFELPETLRLQSVGGADVGGWEIQGAGTGRRLRVIFRRKIADETRLTINMFLELNVGASSLTIAVPQIKPLDVANEIGQVAVFAGDQISIRAEQVESLAQADSEKFSIQVPTDHPNIIPQLVYRFSKRPYTLALRVTRQASQLHVTAQHAALITPRKQNLTTRLRLEVTGAPRSSLSVALPAGFVLLDVQATGMRDWYVASQGDGLTMTIELAAPRMGLVEVVIAGFTLGDNIAASVRFPQPNDATRIDSTAAIWLDEGLTGSLDTFDGWRSIDISHVSGELLAVRSQQPVRFAFSSTTLNPSPIGLKLTQAVPKLSVDGLSMVTVTDVAVIYTFAFQWQIDSATTETLSLTTPSWLAGKLEFQGPGLHEATSVDAGGNRSRWTIHLRTPVRGKYFATATATLSPAAAEVLAPAIVFEADQRPLDAQRQYVLLINSSMSQLISMDPALIEAVQREDLPVVVQQVFIDQAAELVRVKSLLTAPKWSQHKFTQQPGAPASVNAADLTSILCRDGTYRAQAIYTIKNRSRQFLALRMPEGTELLSVFVADQPSRAVEAKLPSQKGGVVQLIALPKTSTASLSFPVKLVWRGRLADQLPLPEKFATQEVSFPAPQILSQKDDEDYGIPVARTRWTVYVPSYLDATAARSTAKHNLSLSDDSNKLYGNAMLQETGELLGFLEQILASSDRSRSVSSVKQISVATENLKRLGMELDRYSGANDAEFEKNKTEIKKRLSAAQQMAADQNQKTQDFLLRSRDQTGQQRSVEFLSGDQEEEEIIAGEQQRALIESNSTTLVSTQTQQDDQEFNFHLEVHEPAVGLKSNVIGEKSPAKKIMGRQSSPANETRQQLRDTNSLNIDALNSVVTNNSVIRGRQSGQQVRTNQVGVQVDSNRNAEGVPNVGAATDGGHEQFFGLNLVVAQQPGAGQQPPQAGGGVPLAAAGQSPLGNPAGGLSLGIDLPTSGRKLVFTKVGGDPKLALVVRSQESLRRGISLIWSAVWLLMGVTILLTLRKESWRNRLPNLLPWGAVVLGILGFFALPAPFNLGSFLLSLLGTFPVAWRCFAPAGVEESAR